VSETNLRSLRQILKSDILIILLIMVGYLILQLGLIFYFADDYSQACRWDCGWYGNVIKDGYDVAPGERGNGGVANWAFFPLNPLIGGLVSGVTGLEAQPALQIGSELANLAAIFALFILFRTLDPNFDRLAFALVIIANPYSIYTSAGYSEPIFITMMAASLYFARSGNVVLQNLFAAVSGTSRVTGIIVAGANVIQAAASRGIKTVLSPHYIFWFLISGLGLAAFILFLYFHTGDGLAFRHVQVAWSRTPDKLLRVLSGFMDYPPTDYRFWGSLGVIASISVLPGILIWKKHYDLAVIHVISVVLPAMTNFISLPRYMMWQVSTFFILYLLMKNRFTWPVLIGLMLVLKFLVFRSWFAGDNWVI
tara:strand:- start:6129 stop:7226 length:1098 start_codon:yes stop_codon:yes gene_type:complete